MEIINDNWIGIEEAAQYMGVTKETIRNWIKKPIFQLIKSVSYGSFRKASWKNG